MKKLLPILFLIYLVSACGRTEEEKRNEETNHADTLTEEEQDVSALEQLETVITSDTSLLEVARIAVRELSSKKIPSSYCLNKPLLFSPSAFVDRKTARVINDTASLNNFFKDKAKYSWGNYDGSGEPIKLTNEEYYSKFIFDRDYTKADDIAVNKFLGGGNTKNNVKEVFPNAHTVDFHFKDDAKTEIMDWSTLRLVFERVDGKYCLVAIVHDQWSI